MEGNESVRKNGMREEERAHRMAHYQAADINDRLIINLRDLSHTMRCLFEGKGSQKRVLIVLNETGTITQQALTERLGIQPGSASEVFAKLESAGLIQRTPSDTDRRTADITLTGEGRVRAAEALEQRNRRHEEMFSCLSAEEKAQLLSLLEKVTVDWYLRYQDANGEKEPQERRRGGRCGRKE